MEPVIVPPISAQMHAAGYCRSLSEQDTIHISKSDSNTCDNGQPATWRTLDPKNWSERITIF
jgi:hypothetical protein